jgi:ABC-2 type transport system permease protein
MKTRIMLHELRTLARERTLWVALGVFAALLAYGVANGVRWSERTSDSLEAVRYADETRYGQLRIRLARIEEGPEQPGEIFRDPTQPGTVGRSLGERSAILPLSPLAATAVGQSDILPSVVPVTTRTRFGLPGREAIANPLHLLTGRLDLAFVILFLLPLLVLALSYDMLSREREGGTLGLLLSQPIRLGTVLAAKVAARGLAVLGIVIPLTLGALALGGVDLTSAASLPRVLLWVGVVIAYTGFWLALAALANLLGRNSAQQAVGLAAVWLLLAVIVPSAITFGGRLLHPVPPRAEMIGAEREAARIAQSQGNSLLARNYEDHPELAPLAAGSLDDFMSTAYAVQEEIDELMEPVRREYDERIAGQQRLAERFRFLSPVLLAQGALDDIAGTGDRRHAGFQAQVEAFRLAFHDYFRPLIYQQHRFTSKDVAGIPQWSYQDESEGRLGGRVGVALLGILAPTLLLTGACVRALPRFSRTG